MSVEEIVITERIGGVLVVKMNRPEKRNALSSTLRQGIRGAFDDFERDPELRSAVLTGLGNTFCAGADLSEMRREGTAVPPVEWGLLLGHNGAISKPVIAAVNGAALGGGFRLAQECDLCVAAESASFGITEVQRGRGAPWAAPLISMVPQRIMMELLLTGEAMTACRAYDVGLVNTVVPNVDLLDSAVAMAVMIAANAPLSVLAAKRMVRASTEFGRSGALSEADAIYESVYLSADAQEGPRAFSERRAPV